MNEKLTEPLKVIARAPFTVYFDGEALALTAHNRVGEFDILPGHSDFFSMLTPGKVIIETDKESVYFEATNGIITVRNNEVLLFVNM